MNARIHRRHAEPQLREALNGFPAAAVLGPRQCGKTTLAKLVAQDTGHHYFSFDDHATREQAREDPDGFARRLPQHAILDEIQYVPAMMSSIKLLIDNNRQNGRFILTGSANLLRLPQVEESLAGRMHVLELLPMSQCELEDAKPHFLDDLFAAHFAMSQDASAVADHTRRLVAGGYPEAVAHAGRDAAPGGWHRSYLDTLMQRDAVELGRIRDADSLHRLLGFAAAATAQQVSTARLSTLLGIARQTVNEYIALLEKMFLATRLPAFTSNPARRDLAGSPKIHAGDTGIAAAMLDQDAATLDANPTLRGHLLETFVLQELRRQAVGSPRQHAFSHYRRNKSGAEVDIVVERHGGSEIAGIKVKASSTPSKRDFKWLRELRDDLGKRFVCGVVLHEGSTCAPFGDRLFAVPIRQLWERPQTSSA